MTTRSFNAERVLDTQIERCWFRPHQSTGACKRHLYVSALLACLSAFLRSESTFDADGRGHPKSNKELKGGSSLSVAYLSIKTFPCHLYPSSDLKVIRCSSQRSTLYLTPCSHLLSNVSVFPGLQNLDRITHGDNSHSCDHISISRPLNSVF